MLLVLQLLGLAPLGLGASTLPPRLGQRRSLRVHLVLDLAQEVAVEPAVLLPHQEELVHLRPLRRVD